MIVKGRWEYGLNIYSVYARPDCKLTNIVVLPTGKFMICRGQFYDGVEYTSMTEVMEVIATQLRQLAEACGGWEFSK